MVASVSLCCFAVAVCQYSAVLFLILVAEIGSAVLLGVYKSSINKCLECSMQHQVQYSYNKTDLPHIKSDNATDLLTLAWDRMQEGVSAAVSSYMTEIDVYCGIYRSNYMYCKCSITCTSRYNAS